MVEEKKKKKPKVGDILPRKFGTGTTTFVGSTTQSRPTTKGGNIKRDKDRLELAQARGRQAGVPEAQLSGFLKENGKKRLVSGDEVAVGASERELTKAGTEALEEPITEQTTEIPQTTVEQPLQQVRTGGGDFEEQPQLQPSPISDIDTQLVTATNIGLSQVLGIPRAIVSGVGKLGQVGIETVNNAVTTKVVGQTTKSAFDALKASKVFNNVFTRTAFAVGVLDVGRKVIGGAAEKVLGTRTGTEEISSIESTVGKLDELIRKPHAVQRQGFYTPELALKDLRDYETVVDNYEEAMQQIKTSDEWFKLSTNDRFIIDGALVDLAKHRVTILEQKAAVVRLQVAPQTAEERLLSIVARNLEKELPKNPSLTESIGTSN